MTMSILGKLSLATSDECWVQFPPNSLYNQQTTVDVVMATHLSEFIILVASASNLDIGTIFSDV